MSNLPDIVIGGAPRSGTSFLCEVLDKHPDVYLAKPIAPEPKVLLTGHPDGDAGILKRYDSYFADAPPHLVRIEKTTNYFENEDARLRFARLLPKTKLIILLRNPVDRAYSNWLWSRKNGLETLSFEEALSLEGKRPSPLPPGREAARPFDYTTRGRYGSLARAWIEALGRDRIGFFIFEDILSRPEYFVAAIQAFGGLTQLSWSVLQTGRINATEADKPIDPETAKRLRERFVVEISDFHDLTGVDVSAWGV
ncbi:MAG: hypothetical protein NTAFB05_05560 [Nitrobacter sp.]|uniref:sulfotransferase family protein n=1 Tax=Nitrobacter sp. TaxID=29420 RepID=UPI00387DE9E3